ncbi:uncharacterized protein HGUI_03009 [Hanseniaspora guilliermondii]|uniref:Origin recognition complex subunit 5 C-terminal domain-containing protein n=1 Tax=Hanseniaspora guilliermondii TaxID=56406 RepID=A0A1L0CQN5_9ASCO|nr:uncharacterized protein HGUI_03009 [Hanseniaspora guilliermondii]
MSNDAQSELTEDEVSNTYDQHSNFSDEYYIQDDQQLDDMNDIYDNYQGFSDNENDEYSVDHFKNTMRAKAAYESFHVEFRETQAAMLTSFLDIYKQPDCFPSLQFVCGPPSSGADYTIKTMLKHFKKTTENFEYISIKKSSVIDFKGFLKTTARELYNLLNYKYKSDLNKVMGSELEGKQDKKSKKKVMSQRVKSGLDSRAMESFPNFRDYVHNLLLFFNSVANEREHMSIYIHLQEYDLYQQVDYHTLSRMVKIFEGLSGSIFHIKIIASFTQPVLMTQYLGTNLNPAIINFPRYTEKELQQILIKYTCKDIVDVNVSFGISFITFCVESFIDMVGININLFTLLIRKKFNESIDQIYDSDYDFMRFLKRNKHIFKDVYTLEDDEKENKEEDVFEFDDEGSGTKRQKIQAGMERYADYSLVTKYVIISSYYCSHFAEKYDCINFVKDVDEIKSLDASKASSIKAMSKSFKREPMKAPKGFEFERMLYVFNILFYQDRNNAGFIEQNNGSTGTDIHVYQSFTSLIDAKIVGKNINDYYDVYKPECRYKFLAPIEEVRMIAEEINFQRMELLEI